MRIPHPSILLLALTLVALPVRALDEKQAQGYVFSVTVSSSQQLDVVLDRAEDLRALFNPDEHGKIAIVLHGDELQLFQKNSYATNRSVVERARMLDQDNIIDIKACQTMMRVLDIEQNELPSFIEQVPFAPAEIERLQNQQGFTRL
ncbi:MAG: DsrE family protein [Gammaproteobacteria bacterium]|nr:DsrE family protein [Gammaproteobacteria bacterium]MDH3860046.1 DsrE family protein [Gammaproteobacteria bacterium]